MAGNDDDLNAYEVLGITLEATEGEIKTAYRQRSLKVHPDRHPNNPDAAHKFHELNRAYELLLDPIQKTSLDASLRVKFARKERFAKFDTKRKGMQDELEKAERASKRVKMDKVKEDRERKAEAERIQEEGRRMRQEREDEINRKEKEKSWKNESVTDAFQLGPLDTTVRVRYQLSNHSALTTPSSLASLFSSFGTIDVSSIVISMKPSKKAQNKPPKFVTALVPFRQIGEAYAAVCASGLEAKGLKDIEVSWAEGKVPQVLDALKRTHQLYPGGNQDAPTSASSQPNSSSTHTAASRVTAFSTSSPSFSFDPSDAHPSASVRSVPGLDYESITLMRLRQAERERIEREIREQEAIN